MYKNLYDSFKHWYRGGTIYLYSDPHFGDTEMQALRKDYIGDDEQVKRINSKVGKNDTIIFLGDIGDVEFIKKIRGYKVLIMGNHDKGASNYKKLTFRPNIGDVDKQEVLEKIEVLKKKIKERPSTSNQSPIDISAVRNTMDFPIDELLTQYSFDATDAVTSIMADAIDYIAVLQLIDKENLFDEVYEGALMISDKILLSHEPVDFKYALNIHGHDHSRGSTLDSMHINICAEHINYTPVALKDIINSGKLKNVPNIHRETIDKAIAKQKIRLYNNISE